VNVFLKVRCRMALLFFFSSRRRHTRWPRDWSSDVCSSDLRQPLAQQRDVLATRPETQHLELGLLLLDRRVELVERGLAVAVGQRSEERRVGKEFRCRWSAAR